MSHTEVVAVTFVIGLAASFWGGFVFGRAHRWRRDRNGRFTKAERFKKPTFEI